MRFSFLIAIIILLSSCKAIQSSSKTNSKSQQSTVTKKKYINFTLKNDSSESIPLLIPSVMNPNLSPNSESAVSLQIGQKVLFRQNGKKHVLLTVSDEIKDGDMLEVSSLLKAKKEALKLAKK